MCKVWQSICKPGEYDPDEGKWYAQRRGKGPATGHLVGPVMGPFDTKDQAESAGGNQVGCKVVT